MKWLILLILLIPLGLVSAEQQVCCEKTLDDNYCQYTEVSNCAEGMKAAPTNCEQTSYCKLGCCFSSDEGRCYKSTPKASCDNQQGYWKDNKDCEIDQCRQGCCLLGEESFFVTQTRCKKETMNFPYAEMTFLEDINDEQSCIDLSRSQEKGACVQSDGTCVFTTRDSCNTANIEEISETLTEAGSGNKTKEGFHKDFLCSNELLGTECAKQQYTGCHMEDVYWFDSCGNPENIYDSDKRTSYNNGFVLREEDSCSNLGIDCGNCDYSLGTLCSKAPRNIQPSYGDYICDNLDCESIYEDSSSPNSGGDKKNGESWCIYDAAIGFGRDVVGSRHYRHLCINGEEMVEECEDYREEICVQGILGRDAFPNKEVFNVRGSFVESACRENRWDDCEDIDNQKDCENEALGDCYWLRIGLRPVEGVCVSHVPPGMSFWGDDDIIEREGQAEFGGSSSSPEADEGRCDLADQTCVVKWRRGGIYNIASKIKFEGVIKGISNTFGKIPVIGIKSEDWECYQNCHCLDRDWVIASHNFCKALGDCGAYYNVEGKLTMDGFDVDPTPVGGELKKGDVGNWDAYASAICRDDGDEGGYGEQDECKEPGFMDELSRRDTFGKVMGIILVGGVLGGTRAIQAATIVEKSKVSRFGEGTEIFFKGLWKGLFAGLPWKGKGASIYGTEGGLVAGKEYTIDKIVSSGAYDVTKIRTDYLKSLSESERAKYIGEDGLLKYMENKELNALNSKALENVGVIEKGSEGNFVLKKTPPTGTATFMNWVNFYQWVSLGWDILDIMFKDTKETVYEVDCNIWEAPLGGKDCEKCNRDMKTCSEYRCRSLGQNCRLINPGTSKEKCIDVAPNDATSPIIRPDREELQKGYTIGAEADGFIVNEEIPAFTPFSLGIETDEPSQCKWSFNHSMKYEDMNDIYFGDSSYEYKHKMVFSLSNDFREREILAKTNNGRYTLYVRCRDGNGNANNKDYYIKLEIDKGPDLTPPVLEATSIVDNGYLQQGVNETDLSIYLNEPATCKYSSVDTDYDLMENEFECVTSGFQRTNIYYGLYECETRLTGLKEGENKFFIRCKDNPGKDEIRRNVNEDSFGFTLIGTSDLEIIEASPKDEIFYDNSVEMYIRTDEGAQNGVAICGYGVGDDTYVEFLETNSNEHRQRFENLEAGSYDYDILCRDIAGNIAEDEISFSVDVDYSGPSLVRIYKDTVGGILHIETNEDSWCVYSNIEMTSFVDGTKMTGDDSKEHEASLNDVFYVVCRDKYDNEASYIIYP